MDLGLDGHPLEIGVRWAGVGARRVQIPSEEVLGALGIGCLKSPASHSLHRNRTTSVSSYRGDVYNHASQPLLIHSPTLHVWTFLGTHPGLQERMNRQRKEKANKAARKREMFNKEMLGLPIASSSRNGRKKSTCYIQSCAATFRCANIKQSLLSSSW